MICKNCGQEIHKLDVPLNLSGIIYPYIHDNGLVECKFYATPIEEGPRPVTLAQLADGFAKVVRKVEVDNERVKVLFDEFDLNANGHAIRREVTPMDIVETEEKHDKPEPVQGAKANVINIEYNQAGTRESLRDRLIEMDPTDTMKLGPRRGRYKNNA